MPRNEAHKQQQQLQAASANTSKPQETQNNLDQQYNQTSTDPHHHHHHHHSSLGCPEAVNGANGDQIGDNDNNNSIAAAAESNGCNNTSASGHQQQRYQHQLPLGSKFRCYLCETPKHEYSLIRSFSEIVCRSCLNYEGPERVEQLILDARRDKGGSTDHLTQSRDGSYHIMAASIGGPQPRLPYTRQPRQLAGGGGRRPLPPAPPTIAGGRLGTEQNGASLPVAHQTNRQHWPHSSYSSVSAPPLQPPLPVAEAGHSIPPESSAKRRRVEPSTTLSSLLPAEASLAGDKCQQPRQSPTPKLAWKSNDSADHNNNNKSTQHQNHQARQQQQQPCRSASTSLASYPQYHQPNQPAYTHPPYQTVGSPILAVASAPSSQHHQPASLLQETIGARSAAGSLSPISLSASPSGGGCGSGSAKQKGPPSAAAASATAAATAAATPVGFAHQTARQQHMQTAALPPPPSHLPYLLNFPPMVHDLGPSPCDQFAREQQVAAYEFYMGQQRSHLAQEAASHHQLYPTSHHAQFEASGATKGSHAQQTTRSRPATLAALRCAGSLTGPVPVPPAQPSAAAASSHLAMLVHPTDKPQQAMNPASLYQPQPAPGSPYHISPYVSQLAADIHYGYPIPIPYAQHQHHHHNANTMGSVLAAAAAAAAAASNRLPSYGCGTSMMMSDPSRLKGSSSSSSTTCGDEPLPANHGHDFHLKHQHQMESNFLARQLMQQNESFHHQIQQIARKQFPSPINTRTHHRPPPAPLPQTTNSSGESGPLTAANHHQQQQATIDGGSPISPQLSSSSPTATSQDSNTLTTIPNTETTLRLLLNQDKLVSCEASIGATNGSRQLATTAATGRQGKEPEVGRKDKSSSSGASLGQASKYAPSSGGSTILSHNHNPNKPFQLEPIVPAAITAKRRFNLEEISSPPKTHKSSQKQEQAVTSKRNQSMQSKQQQQQQQQEQPIVINEEEELEKDELEVNLTTNSKPRTYSNAPNSGLNYQPSRTKHFRPLSSGGGGDKNNNKNKSLLTTLVDPTIGPLAAVPVAPGVASNESSQAQANGNYSLRSQSTGPQSATPAQQATGKINGFCGEACQNAEQQNGVRSSSKNRNTNSTNGPSGAAVQPTSGGATNSTTPTNHTQGPAFDQLKCLLCQERLEDRHFVQCPTVQLHKFCFACSKSSIKRQRKSNQESKSIEDKIFCPSGKKCLLASEQSPWTFMNNEIETIFREGSRVPQQPTTAPAATAAVSIAPPRDLIQTNLRPTDRQHSNGLNGFGIGLTKPNGSGMKNGNPNLPLDAKSSNNIATLKENSTSDKNNGDNTRHSTKQQ